MTKRVVLGALMGALMVVATGCSDECTDEFDCRNKKGEPGEGKEWVCVSNKCETQDTTPPPTGEDDAGTQPDSGTPTEDGGTTTDGGTSTDGGTTTDAGTMTLKEGEACTDNASCMAGLFCEDSGGTKKCQPLHIALTRNLTTATVTTSDAVVVRYKTPGSEPATGTTDVTKLSESTTGQSRFPRWNKDGTAVAFVEQDATGNVSLVTRNLPLVSGQKTTLTTATNAGTEDFVYMEWEPSSSIAWATKTGMSTSGISVIPGAGGSVQSATDTGVFPSWAADGNSFAYNSGGLGLQTQVLGGTQSAVSGAGTNSEQPLHNNVNNILLYLDSGGLKDVSGSFEVPLNKLYTVPASGGTPVLIADVSEETVTGGKLKSYIANHTWAPLGTHVAYVRVYYFLSDTVGGSHLCSGGTECGGKQGNVIFVRRIDANGQPQGTELMFATEATLPSFSPDGHFIAYLSGGKLNVQQLDPDATDEASLKVGSAITHTWSNSSVPSSAGDDHRPRWQPR
jgi:Tol biopolymer transport system component